jgi:hypothetical protein
VTITASDASCSWSAAVIGGGEWLSLVGGRSGTGSGAINVSAPRNRDKDRAGSVLVANQLVIVGQSGEKERDE